MIDINDWSSYWLGVATWPALVFALWLTGFAVVRAVSWLKNRWGIFFELKLKSHPNDYSHLTPSTLRHEILWERQLGPVFVGHWYRDWRDASPSHPKVNRWIGLGRTTGPALLVFRTRTLTTNQEHGDTDE